MGNIPKNFGTLCKRRKDFSIEDAISKMTFKTAKVFGLKNRGIIKEGAFADIVLFDPNKIKDRSDFKKSKVPADGIDYVLVNGRIVWSEKMHSYERPGKFINSNDMAGTYLIRFIRQIFLKLIFNIHINHNHYNFHIKLHYMFKLFIQTDIP